MIHPTYTIERREIREAIVDFDVNMFVIFHHASNFGIATQSLEGEEDSRITFSDNCTNLTLLPALASDMRLFQAKSQIMSD